MYYSRVNSFISVQLNADYFVINISTETIICYCLLLGTIVLSQYYYTASYLLFPYVFKLISLIAYNFTYKVRYLLELKMTVLIV